MFVGHVSVLKDRQIEPLSLTAHPGQQHLGRNPLMALPCTYRRHMCAAVPKGALTPNSVKVTKRLWKEDCVQDFLNAYSLLALPCPHCPVSTLPRVLHSLSSKPGSVHFGLDK